MSVESTDTGFFSGFNIGDAFDVGLEAFVAREKYRAQQGSQTQVDDQDQLINRPDNITQRPNAQPQVGGYTQVTAGSAGGAGTRINIAGVELNRTALYIAGAALAGYLYLKAVA
jgi:hypothetical protein